MFPVVCCRWDFQAVLPLYRRVRFASVQDRICGRTIELSRWTAIFHPKKHDAHEDHDDAVDDRYDDIGSPYGLSC